MICSALRRRPHHESTEITTPSASPPEPLADEAARLSALIEASRARSSRSAREAATLWISCSIFAATAIGLPLIARPSVSPAVWGSIAAGVAALAAASAIELELGAASVVPTEPVLIALLFLVPPSLVPIIVVVGLGTGAQLIHWRTGRLESPLVTACSAVHSIGPAIVVMAVHDPGAPGHRWLVLAAVLGAQVLSEGAVSLFHNCVGLGVGVRQVLGMLRWCTAVDLALAPAGLLAWVALGSSTATVAVALFPVALVALLAVDREQQMDRLVALGTAYDEAHRRARRDPLTSLGNRLAWNEAVQQARIQGSEPTAVVLLDVDRLKQVNDRYGHDAGDRLLRTVGAVVKAQVPPGGQACRIGGDEFAVLLVGAMASAHRSVGQAISEATSRRPPIGDVEVSVSVGSAVASGATVLDTIQLADDALYGAKRSRRNRADRTILT